MLRIFNSGHLCICNFFFRERHALTQNLLFLFGRPFRRERNQLFKVQLSIHAITESRNLAGGWLTGAISLRGRRIYGMQLRIFHSW